MTINIGNLLTRRANINANIEALYDVAAGRRFSYAELNAETNKVASLLVDAGVKKGDRVALLLMNSSEFMTAFFATAKLGAVIVPLNWRLIADELEFILKDSGTTVLVFGSEFVANVSELQSRGDRTDIKSWLYVGDASTKPPFARDFIVESATMPATEPAVTASGDDLLYIMYTSGTTGLPKGAVHTQAGFLANAQASHEAHDFQDNDIVFIPYYDRRVRLRGEIKTPAVFELLPNEHLQSAITYAGGYTEIAYQEVVEVLRYGGDQKELFTVRAEELADFKLLGSEIVTVSSIMDRYSNRVKVDGAVERPGYYSMADGIDLKKAIENAGGLKPSAIKEYVLLFREPRDGQNHYYAYRLDSILAGNMRIELQENDMILVGDSLDMNREDKVHIYGDVNKQGEYLFGAGITVSKLLFLAGGFEQEALTSKIIISRKVEDETQLATVNVLSARRDFWNDKALNEFVLKPGDVVTVSRNPYYRKQVYVTCEGEFKVPGVYPMASRNQSLYDIYMQAGGSNQYGNVDGSILIRQRKIQISTAKIESLKAKVLNELYAQDTLKEVDELNYKPDSLVIDTIVIGGYRNFETTAKSFYLQPGDRFIIPTIESTVSILGEVYNPNVIMYDKKLTLKRYIIMAGGTTEEAKKNNIFVVYSNGRSAKTRRFLGVFKLRPAIRPGCQIIVPSKSKGNDANSRLSATERITMYSVMASTMSSLAYLISQIVK